MPEASLFQTLTAAADSPDRDAVVSDTDLILRLTETGGSRNCHFRTTAASNRLRLIGGAGGGGGTSEVTAQRQ